MKEYKLKDLLEIKNGKDHSSLNDGEIPVFGSGGLMRFVNEYLYSDESILLPRKGSLSNIQYVNQPFWTVDTIYYSIINKEKAVPYYLYNYLRLLDLSKLNSGTGVPSMTYNSYYNIKVNLPEPKIQKQVANILSALDNKIELNNKINAILEAKAKLLYDYWFVQFEFPTPAGSSSGIEGKPYKSSGGKMVYNKKLKREIPEGWEVKRLESFIKNTMSGNWGKERSEGNYTERIYCIRGADINGLNGVGEMNIPERYILPKHLDKSLEANDFIIEISGGSPTQSTGRVALITEESFARFDAPLLCTNFCRAITLKNKKLSFNFYREWQRAYDNGVLFQFEGKTSGIKNFLFDSFLKSYNMVEPPKDLIERFYSLSTTIEKKKQSILKQNQHLSSLRDWLLPMLMNGQVSVEKGYEIVEGELGMVAEPGRGVWGELRKWI